MLLDADEDDEDDIFARPAPRVPAGPPPPASWAAAEAAGASLHPDLRARLRVIDPAPIEENLPHASARQMRMHVLEGVAQSAFVASVAGAELGRRNGGPLVRPDVEIENPWDSIPLDLSIPEIIQAC